MQVANSLIERLIRHAPTSRSYPTAIKGFRIARRDIPDIIERCIMTPVIFITVQGKKRSLIGNVPYVYESGNAIVLGMDIPADSCVLEASPEKPYLSMVLELDPTIISQIHTELVKANLEIDNMYAVISAPVDLKLFDAFERLSELLDKPSDIDFISPMIIKEIHYRLLTGPLGGHIIAIHTLGSKSNQISQAITWMEANYKKTLKIEELAAYVNMAVSTFHRNFKQVTTLSPLQFQKKLRLLEAQRLMLVDGVDATAAAYNVGYESQTQFSREYKRMFGNPPITDIKKIINKTTDKL